MHPQMNQQGLFHRGDEYVSFFLDKDSFSDIVWLLGCPLEAIFEWLDRVVPVE